MAIRAQDLRKAQPRKRTARRVAREMGIAVASPADQLAKFSECRALGHDWHHLGSPDLTWNPTPEGVYGWHSKCRECGTERVKWFTRRGMSAGLTYRNYPDGYRSTGPNDPNKLDREGWGKVFIRSHLGAK